MLCFFLLIYVHVSFGWRPVRCLDGVKNTWPRDGVLRVEVVHRPRPDYGLADSYEKERAIHLRHARQHEEIGAFLWAFSSQGYGN